MTIEKNLFIVNINRIILDFNNDINDSFFFNISKDITLAFQNIILEKFNNNFYGVNILHLFSNSFYYHFILNN